LPIFKPPKEIVLTSLKEKGNADYYLLDTGSVLKLLPRLDSLFHRLDKDDVNLAMPEITIEQIVEHLMKSFSKKKEQQVSTYNVEEGMRNFVRLLDDKSILKVSNPTEIPIKYNKQYKEFEEDEILAFTLFEGNFKGIITEDGKLQRNISKSKIVLNYKDLLR